MEELMRRAYWNCIVLAFGGIAIIGCDGGEEGDADGGIVIRDSGARRDTGSDPEDSGARMDSGGGEEDSGGGGDEDGGGGTADGGSVGDCVPAAIDLMEDCGAFDNCGGELSGSHCYTAVCLEEGEILGPLEALCEGAMIEDFSGFVVGSVDFGAEELAREARTHVEGTIVIPPTALCVFLGCDGLEDQINERLAGRGSADCSDTAAGGCSCDIELDTETDESTPYTTSGGEITLEDDRTYDYCVGEDGDVQVRETTPGEATDREPGIQTLSPAG
jgi:hypothetical protein